MTRDERQDAFIPKFEAVNGRGTLEACTAFGKTRVAIKVIKRLRKTNPNREVIIVVPNEYLKKQWETVLIEHGVSDNVTINIINSHVNKSWDCSLLILDEIHRYAADTFKEVFSVTSYRFILGLTAQVKRLDRKHSLLTSYAPIIDRVTLEEATLRKWVSEYQEFNISVELDPMAKIRYDSYNEMYVKAMDFFQWDFNLMRKCSVSYKPHPVYGSACQQQAIEYGWKGNNPKLAHDLMLAGHKDFWGGSEDFHPKAVYITAINGMRGMRKLKDIISVYPKKLHVAREILEALPERKAITFADRTDTADTMRDLIPNSASYHSSLTIKDDSGKILSKKKGKEYIIKQVNDNKINVIHTAKALDEGADFPEISLGIRISGSSSPVQQLQRRGRIIRKHNEKKAVMVNIYIKDTKEEGWLTKSQGNTNGILWVDSVKELIDKIKT